MLDVAYATTDSPLGPLLLASTDQGLVRVAYLDFADRDEVLQSLADRVSPRMLEAPGRLDEPRRELDDYFGGRRREFDLPLDRRLMTDFMRRCCRRRRRSRSGRCRRTAPSRVRPGARAGPAPPATRSDPTRCRS